MSLAEVLKGIATTEGLRQEALMTQFKDRIKGHPEEKLLNDAYIAACSKKLSMSFGRNAVPPKSLKDEGFVLRCDACGFRYCWGY